MLAYELFYYNKDSTTNHPKKQLPIKKIFYKNNNIIIDKNTLEKYGSEVTKTTEQLQKWLIMSLNTINVKKLNLPDLRTGTAGANPYIEIYGYLKTNRALESKLSITIGKKSNQIDYSLDVTTGEIKNKSEGKIKLKLDKRNYLLNSNSLFSEYVNSGIIDDEGILNVKVYDDIIKKFLEFTKEQKPNITKIGNISFRIFILPDDSIIEFKEQIKKEHSNEITFTDYFGNTVSEYASTPTQTTKFLSYDDKAFTINCMLEKNFYKNLGIGNNSLEKIYTDPSQTFKICRLNWTFINISEEIDFKFVETKKGILTQLYENYRLLSKDMGSTVMSQSKIICIRVNQAKQEVLIDENLTMKKMEKMFSDIKDIPPLCFEVLIDDSGKNPIWNTYLYVVKNFLAGNNIPKSYLLAFFNKILKQKRYEWVKSKNDTDQKEFFLRTNFCLQNLLTVNKLQSYMDQNEEFAEKVGQIVRIYIEFKQSNDDEKNNSLSDILTYSKYDRERLRFIVSRIGRGVQLSKAEDGVKKEVNKKISSLQPKKEIEDDVLSKDYSYFFFKGYYTNERIVA